MGLYLLRTESWTFFFAIICSSLCLKYTQRHSQRGRSADGLFACACFCHCACACVYVCASVYQSC